MIPCNIEENCGAWLITFADGRTLLLTTDCDRASFAVRCGAIRAADDWDGNPETLPGWGDFDPGEIQQCPDDYADLAE